MDILMRLSLCRLSEKIHDFPQIAQELHLADESHFLESKKIEVVKATKSEE